MKTVRARTAGFCMGVSLALQKLDKAMVDASGRTICTLGPIIHNPQVLADYAAQGVCCMQNIADVDSSFCVLIRAHGIPRELEEEVRATGAQIVDATCPKVKKAQLAIAEATSRGAVLLLFGERNHPEVQGLVSYAHSGAHVFGSLEELTALALTKEASYVLASQTTQDKHLFDVIRNTVEGSFPDTPVLATICDATRLRQEEAYAIAANVDAMIVVGGRESGNTRRLADVAAGRGIPAYHVESCDELEAKAFSGFSCVGLTAGASTPRVLIDAAEAWLLRL